MHEQCLQIGFAWWLLKLDLCTICWYLKYFRMDWFACCELKVNPIPHTTNLKQSTFKTIRFFLESLLKTLWQNEKWFIIGNFSLLQWFQNLLTSDVSKCIFNPFPHTTNLQQSTLKKYTPTNFETPFKWKFIALFE